MNFNKDDILDLNEESIKELFTYCVATKNSNPEDVISANFMEKASNTTVPDMYFLKDRIKEKSKSIMYILGQLKSVHSKEPIIFLNNGFYKYDNTTWTQNKMLLFSLYYMGNAINVFPHFSRSSNGFLGFLENYPELKPTLSPNDPNFRKKTDGQEPADD